MLVPLPIVLPLLGAGVTILVGRSRRAQRIVSVAVLSALVANAVALVILVDRDGPIVARAGGWIPPMGITLVADRLSTITLTAASIALLLVVINAIGHPGTERHHVGFQSVYLVMTAGVGGALLAGDLFNLFVAIEMMLTASYVLITLGGRVDQVRSSMTYVVISLVASSFFLVGISFIYASTATVNLAELAGRLEQIDPGMRLALAVVFLIVFGIKAGLFPLCFWLPDSYPNAPSPVAAIFAALLTKIGVYAIIRTQTLLFSEVVPTWMLMSVAVATMLVGVLGAIAQDDLRRLLSFLIISSIGFMLVGISLFTVLGVTAAIMYMINQVLLKSGLFLAGGLVQQAGGSARLSELHGMIRRAPIVAVLFLIPAWSLIGIPPMAGFPTKFVLFDAAAASGYWWVLGFAVLAALLTLFAMMRAFVAIFWGDDTDEQKRPLPRLMVGPTVALALLMIGLGIFAGPFYDLCHRAAIDLLHPQGYLDAVLGGDS